MQRPVTFTAAQGARIGTNMGRTLPDPTAYRWRKDQRELQGPVPVACKADPADWRVATRWLAAMHLRAANVSGFAARLP